MIHERTKAALFKRGLRLITFKDGDIHVMSHAYCVGKIVNGVLYRRVTCGIYDYLPTTRAYFLRVVGEGCRCGWCLDNSNITHKLY